VELPHLGRLTAKRGDPVGVDRKDEEGADPPGAGEVGFGDGGVGSGAEPQGQKALDELPTTRVFLPSYSPELNPAERIFEEVRRLTWRGRSTRTSKPNDERPKTTSKSCGPIPSGSGACAAGGGCGRY
jgi:hypothetical protein